MTSGSKFCSMRTMSDFTALLTDCTGWTYAKFNDCYCFGSSVRAVTKILRTDLLAIDCRLPQVLNFFGPYAGAVDNLSRTLDLWSDASKMIYLRPGEAAYGMDILRITEVIVARATFCMKCRCYRIDRVQGGADAWAAGPDVEHSAEFKPSTEWIEAHFPGGTTRLLAGVSLGLTAVELAASLYEKAEPAAAAALPDLDSSA